MSRYYRCLVVTALSLEGFSHRKPLAPAVRDMCCAQQNATVHWTWSNTAEDLGLTNDDCNPQAVGQRWYDYASEHLERWNSTNLVDSTDAQVASPGAAQQSPQNLVQGDNPISFRGCKLVLLRFLRSMLKVSGYTSSLVSLMQESSSFALTHDLKKGTPLMGLLVAKNWWKWFYHTWSAKVRLIQNTYIRPLDGAVLSLLPFPLRRTEFGGLFSFIVQGIGSRHVSMWAMGGAEFLAMQVAQNIAGVFRENCLDIVRQGKFRECCTQVASFVGCAVSQLQFDVLTTPHKMRLASDGFESAAAGSNERSDFHIIATCSAKSYAAQTSFSLGFLYHTTNCEENTFSGRADVLFPESRLLWVSYLSCNDMVELAFGRFAELVYGERGIAVPKELKSCRFQQVDTMGGHVSDDEHAPTEMDEADYEMPDEDESEDENMA